MLRAKLKMRMRTRSREPFIHFICLLDASIPTFRAFNIGCRLPKNHPANPVRASSYACPYSHGLTRRHKRLQHPPHSSQFPRRRQLLPKQPFIKGISILSSGSNRILPMKMTEASRIVKVVLRDTKVDFGSYARPETSVGSFARSFGRHELQGASMPWHPVVTRRQAVS